MATGKRGADRGAKRTADRILDAALESFATRGYEATSLDALAKQLGVRKQTILYWFPSKEALLDAVIDRSAVELSGVLERSVASSGPGWERIDAIVRAVFRMALRRPELLGLLREVSRLGPPTSTRLVDSLAPLVEKATLFLEHEMDAGRMRRTDPGLLLMSVYSTVIGMATEVEVLRAVGIEPTLSAAINRRNELLQFLRSALLTPEQLAAEAGDQLPAG